MGMQTKKAKPDLNKTKEKATLDLISLPWPSVQQDTKSKKQPCAAVEEG